MPLDINLFRADRGGDPERVRESQRRRFASVEIVDQIIAQDSLWRQLTGDIDNLKKERNTTQKQVGIKMKAGEECNNMVQQIKEINENIERKELEKENLRVQIDSLIGKVGNLVDLNVPVSQDEDKDNAVIQTWGTPRDPTGLLNHHDLLWRIGGYEPERGVGVAGHRAYFLRDVGVLLNQAFINYGIAFLRKKGYICLQPPYFMKKSVMSGVAQLEQFDEELYKVSGDGEDKYLIATSEQPICGYHMGEWLEEKSLPLRYCGISTCFRKEAGSHGKDTWGIFRVHQFEKVEQFVICEGDLEKSQKLQEEMSAAAEEFYQSLGFPYRVISIVTGALNNAAIRKFDLECWFPGYNAYRELVSCSNCTDYQSRAMEIRSGIKKLNDTEKKYVHMLNATLCATGRAICCLLETYQEPNGVRIPEVLVPFMGGITFLPFVRDSRNAPSVPQAPVKKSQPEKKVTSSSIATPATSTPVVAATSSNSPESVLEASIVAKGEEVRTLKTAKADKVVISAKVDELVALKSKYQELTGKPYGAPSASSASPVPAPSLGPEAQLLDSITTVGNEIRQLKAAKADKDVIKAKVDELVGLKTRYQELSGQASVNSAPVSSENKESKSEKKESKPKVQKKDTPSVVVVSQTPALAPITKQVSPLPTSVWVQGNLNIDFLEAKLKVFSYVGGYEPTAEDNRVLAALIVLGNVSVNYPQISRWLRNVSSFSDKERAEW